MRVKIGPYTSWFGPYQLAELLCFWVKPVKDEYGIENKPDWVHNFGEWLAHGKVEPEPTVGQVFSLDRDRPDTVLSQFLQWVHSKKKQTVKVQIDPWDTWSMDHTLAYVVLPMLKQLNDKKHGAPFVDLKDVPKELHGKKLTKKQRDSGQVDDKHFERWDWVLGEMIFAFDSKVNEGWEAQFESGESDLQFKQLENGMSQMIEGPNHTRTYDQAGRKAYEDRIQNGFRLFGTYYQHLWD